MALGVIFDRKMYHIVHKISIDKNRFRTYISKISLAAPPLITTMKIYHILPLLFFLIVPVYADQPAPLFPFLISYDGANNASSMAHLIEGPAGKNGFIRVENGRFVDDAGPVKLHATNLTGPANFPTHEQADKLAARLRRLGINCVRLHYFDAAYGNFMTPALPGIIADDPNTRLNLDVQQRDRQDYLIAVLKKQGIYVNINLHVRRTMDERDGFFGQKPWADKGLNSFEPRLLEIQRDYAKKLLDHVNPYTKLKYTEDPCVAMVEISNENSFFIQYRGGAIDTMDEVYKKELRKLWSRWLKKKYGSTAAVKDAWQWKPQPLRDEQVPEGTFANPIEFDGKTWILSRSDAKVEAQVDGGVLKLDVSAQGSQYFPKIFRSVQVKQGEIYTLKFRIRRTDGEGNAVLGLAVAEGSSGWKSLGLHKTFSVGKDWQTQELAFEAVENSVRGQIQMTRFPKGMYEIADLSFQAGATKTLSFEGTVEDETAATVPAHGFSPKRAKSDFVAFIRETEENYWTGMRRYLRETLGVRSVVSGTQLGCSPPQVQAQLDYVDHHAYWRHPGPISKDWRIGNDSMVNSFSCILSLAGQRVWDKPYTISEHNHPFPNFFGAEGQPMLRAYGALQGWDGVFEYTYNHSPDFEPKRNTYFFSIIARTDVLAHFPACAAMYLRGDVREAEKSVVAALDEAKYMENLAATNDVSFSIGRGGLDSRLALVHKVGVSLDGKEATDPASLEKLDTPILVSDTGQLRWNREIPSKAYWTVDTPNTKLFSGFPGGRTIELSGVTIKVGKTRLDWATVSLVSRQATGFGEKGKANILLAATGYCENENMKVEKIGDNSITLSDWGDGTVLAEGIPAVVTLPVSGKKVRCFALDPDGNRREEVAVTESERNQARIEISPHHRTVWYEIEIDD